MEEQIQPQGLTKWTKIQETLAEKQDRISVLPDGLLLEILSRLPSIDHAIRTGTLSKRWDRLWTFVPQLKFSHDTDRFQTPDFVSSVSETLSQCHSSKLKKFDLFMRYDNEFEHEVNDWVRYALNSHVEELVLTFWNSDCQTRLRLHEDLSVNSCVTHMKIDLSEFSPKQAISWKMLRCLVLCDTVLSEDLIENILSGSPVLETLKLDYCYGYTRLNISSKSVRNLLWSGYQDPIDIRINTLAIEINAPYISSLKIDGFVELSKLLLLDVSSLVEADLNYCKAGVITSSEEEEEMLKGHLQSLRHVKKLEIGYFSSKVLSRLEAKGFSSPSMIKRCGATSRFELPRRSSRRSLGISWSKW